MPPTSLAGGKAASLSFRKRGRQREMSGVVVEEEMEKTGESLGCRWHPGSVLGVYSCL